MQNQPKTTASLSTFFGVVVRVTAGETFWDLGVVVRITGDETFLGVGVVFLSFKVLILEVSLDWGLAPSNVITLGNFCHLFPFFILPSLSLKFPSLLFSPILGFMGFLKK